MTQHTPNSPWNHGSPTAVQEPQRAWQQASPGQFQPGTQQAPAGFVPQQPAYPGYPQAGPPPFGTGGMPPQGPGPGAYQSFPPPAPRNRTPLIISLVVAAVLVIGGGVGAFFLFSKDDRTIPAPAPSQGGNVVVDPTTGTDPTIGDPAVDPTKEQPTKEQPTKEQPTAQPSSDPTGTGGGDMATAEGLVENWLGFINEGDITTASELICEAERQGFIDGFDGVTDANQLEAVDMQWDGDTIALTLGVVGDTTGANNIALTMWPTDTGYYLICSSPLSEADLNW